MSRPVCALIGDGSSMYSIQALWTAAHLKLPITYIITNNASYRILKQRLLSFHGNNRASSARRRETMPPRPPFAAWR